MDYISLGPTPYDESCAQTVHSDYPTRSRQECRAFINQLERQFPTFEKISFRTKVFNPGGNCYREVVVDYDPSDPESAAQALQVDAEIPAEWDTEAKIELNS